MNVLRLPCCCLALVLAAGCPPPGDTGTPVLLEGPALAHTPPDATFIEGDLLQLDTSATDPDGVAELRAFWRVQGSDTWEWEMMTEVGDGWQVSLQGEAPGMEYYFRAIDGGDTAAVSYLPTEAQDAPFQVEVLVAAQALPFYEEFELADGQDELRDLGWVSYEAEFRGYPWELAEQGLEGSLRVRHALGTGDSSDTMDDWLISPALDFSSIERIQVSWYELGTSVELADHSLWLSTGSRDPSDDEFIELLALSAPGTEWGRSQVLELSDWAGQRVVYLAWRYQGANADTWSIDALAVEVLAPDLAASVDAGADPVHPGDEVSLGVTINNSVDLAAQDVTVGLYVDMGDGGVIEDSATLGSIEALGAADTSFEFTLAESLTDNSRLPYQITIDAGEQSWSQDFELQLGYASTATLELTLDTTALVEVIMGVGDPDAPIWEDTALTSTLAAGTHSISTDITERVDLLPPAPGELRWYALVTPYTTGSVDSFGIEFGAEPFLATHLPALESGVQALVWLPEPPDPQLSHAQTSPVVVQPGDRGVTFANIRLLNDGDASAGSVTASLTSIDPDVTIVDGGPVLVSDGAWLAGEYLYLNNTFSFDVAAEHLDSLPLAFTLLLQDEVEVFEVAVSVEVPWPVLRIIRVSVDDSESGDDDGVLDPGEQAVLEIDLVNTGDQATDGIVRGSLSVQGSSTATATVLSGEESFGSMDPEDSRDEDYELLVTSGALGDTLDLQLDLYDSSASYTAVTQFVLGEPPWLAASAVDDDIGDAIDGYAFDWVNAWYRINEGMFQLRCESATAFDSSTVFIEAWGTSSGAGYVFYQLVVQGGVVDLLGWSNTHSHSTITTPTMSSVDSQNLLIEWDPAVMDLTIDSFSMGFAAGWCGPPEYYCDHLPDGWGYAYDVWDPGAWLDMEW